MKRQDLQPNIPKDAKLYANWCVDGYDVRHGNYAFIASFQDPIRIKMYHAFENEFNSIKEYAYIRNLDPEKDEQDMRAILEACCENRDYLKKEKIFKSAGL